MTSALPGNISTICLIISVSILLFKQKQSPDFIRFLKYCLCWNFAIEIGAYAMLKLGFNNLPLLHLYTLGELLLWSLFYSQVLRLSKMQKRGFSIFIGIAALLVILNSIFLQNIFGFNSYAKTLTNVIFIGCSVLSLSQLLDSKTKSKNYSSPLATINSAVLIYYAGSLLVFMFSDFFLKNSTGLPNGFWVFNGLLNMVFQILVLIAIWKVLVNKNFFSLSP